MDYFDDLNGSLQAIQRRALELKSETGHLQTPMHALELIAGLASEMQGLADRVRQVEEHLKKVPKPGSTDYSDPDNSSIHAAVTV